MIRIALALFLFSSPVMACQSRLDAVDHLADKYNEQSISVGLSSTGGVIEVLSSRTGDTWTMIITRPNGCVGFIAAGENWQRIKPTYTRERKS